jgi:hypothetical protein
MPADHFFALDVFAFSFRAMDEMKDAELLEDEMIDRKIGDRRIKTTFLSFFSVILVLLFGSFVAIECVDQFEIVAPCEKIGG